MQHFMESGYCKYIVIAAAAVFLIFVTILLFYHTSASASSDSRQAGERVECFKSIRVHAGESLWEISKRNYSYEYKSIEKYIGKIKYLNHLLDEDIVAGTYLIIPYYVTLTETVGVSQ